MSKGRKYFGETPLEGPTPINALYKNMKKKSPYYKQNDFTFKRDENNSSYPSPEKLAEYDKVCKGSAHKIMELLERDQKHRHQLDVENIKSKTRAHILEAALAFILSVVVIAATLALTYFGYNSIAIITIIFGMLAVMTMVKNTIATPKKHFGQHKHRNHYKGKQATSR